VPTEHRVHEAHLSASGKRVAVRAGVISLVAGTVIMGTKFVAWMVTGSTALLADAAESVVNVMAAAVVTASVVVASRPADADHPYGHGKAEYLSAAVEGGMIVIAATLIVVEAIRKMITGPEISRVEAGIVIAGAAGLANLALGFYLVRVGRRERSSAVEADGIHVLSDVFTTVGTVGALIAVRFTGFVILDPLVALVVGAHILRAGWRVARRALAGLLDEADFTVLDSIAHELEAVRQAEWVEIHQLRAWSSGSESHVDLHLSLPRYLSVEDAHRVADGLEERLIEKVVHRGDVVVHIDPCLPRHCSGCTMGRCPIRSVPLEERLPFTVENITLEGSI
jgi:cation diffusion facilitator family transporter